MCEPLKMIVCVKQVPDPEGPSTAFQVNPGDLTVTVQGIPAVINPFDENALELALRLKDRQGGTVSVLSLGTKFSPVLLRRALAAGADDLTTVQLDHHNDRPDSYATALLLARAIARCGHFDLVLTGIQASDTNAGQVGLGIAQILDIPALSHVRNLEMGEGFLLVEQVIPGGYRLLRFPCSHLPALFTVGPIAGALRYPSLADIKASIKKPHTRWTASEIDGGMSVENIIRLVGLSVPRRERHCLRIEGETPEGSGVLLAVKLLEDGALRGICSPMDITPQTERRYS